MADLIPVPGNTPVPQLETNTRVRGGPGGPANQQAQALLNRQALLEQRTDRAILSFPDIAAATSAATKLPNGQQVDVTSEQKRYRVEAGALMFVANLDQLRIDLADPAKSGWLIRFVQNGVGSVVRWVMDKLRERVSVLDFGASPTASATVNTAAIQAAADHCEATGAKLHGAPGVYLTNGTITLNCHGDLSEMTIRATGKTLPAAIRVGKLTGATWKIGLRLPQVENFARTPGDGWAGYENNMGVALDNLYNSEINIPSVSGFGVGVNAGGVDAGLSYNKIALGDISNNRVNFRIGPKTSEGWANSNIIDIFGRCRHDSQEANGGAAFSGTRNILLVQANDNLFLKPTIEGSTNVTEFTLEYLNANHNTIIQPRWENSATGGGSGMKIRMEGQLPRVCAGNTIIGGYEFGTSLDYTIVGGPSAVYGNTKFGTGRGDQSFGVQNPIAIQSSLGDGIAQAHFQGFPATVNPLGKSSSATDYTYRLYATGLAGKRAADDSHRVLINWSTAGIYLGDGGVTPTTGIVRVAGVAVGTNSSWFPSATNSLDLGSANYRWKDLFLVNAPNVSSDARTKQQVREISEAERRVAIRCKGLLRAYKLNTAVSLKGDGARIHFGAIAQDVKAAFEAEGLDPFAYGLLCFNKWEAQPAQLDDDENVVVPAVPAGEMFSIRYEEFLAFIIAAL